MRRSRAVPLEFPTRIDALPTVVAVSRSCEKLGCSEPADVAYGIDRVACVVWLENFDSDEARHLNALCVEHASRLTLPRGWSFDDRRERSPRLFNSPRPTSARITPIAKPKTSTKPAAKTTPSAKPAPVEKQPTSAKVSPKQPRTSGNKTTSVPRRTSRESSAPVKRYDGPGLFDPTIPLAPPAPRAAEPAFTESVSASMEPTLHDDTAADSVASPADRTGSNGDAVSSGDEPKYEPRFDRTSDVGGVLNATGRLLRRAFNSQTKPIERPARAGDTDSLPQGDHIDDFNQGDHVE